ncbi:ABC-2 type transport system permease protein [Kineothrix alysoides]|uniref:ABC-2 type transport system permease protein n=1 Tax=Kineothrix alysoides TaxID=1469948 RepID=A0A4R1R343_9FIRM|nr:ABC transporter permease [Kineothrix alysoides]TCL59820.1 ABC-2 type transport system permease protein [Kineothrix alysoides]
MNILSLVICEMRKMYKSSVFWVLIIAFTVLPGISLIKYFNAANVSWDLYLADILKFFTAILIIGFAFTTCWIFGREYTDKTINDLLVKPVSKLKIAVSKFIVIALWNSLLSILLFAVVALIGAYVGLADGTAALILHYFLMFMATSLLTTLVSTVSSFMANVTKGYLAPIGLIFIIVLIVNIVENVGLSAYIPWTIPGLLITDGFLSPISIFIVMDSDQTDMHSKQS